MLIRFQTPCCVQVTNQQTRLPRATSSLALNASRDGESTASLGNLLQCLTTLYVKIICGYVCFAYRAWSRNKLVTAQNRKFFG